MRTGGEEADLAGYWGAGKGEDEGLASCNGKERLINLLGTVLSGDLVKDIGVGLC